MKTPRNSIFCLILLFASIHGDAFGVPGEEDRFEARFRDANGLYADGNYCEAARLYRELVSDGVSDGRLYYNCANAYLKCGKTGRAIQYYEKAVRLLPRDPDVRFNLEFVRSRLEDGNSRPGLIAGILSRIITFFSVEELLVIESVCISLLSILGMIHLHLKTRRSSRRRITAVIVWITGLAVFLSLVFLAVQVIEQSDTEAIVIEDQVDARSGPGTNHVKVLSIPEGKKVWVDEERQGWYLIHLSTGRGGWLPVDTIGVI